MEEREKRENHKEKGRKKERGREEEDTLPYSCRRKQEKGRDREREGGGRRTTLFLSEERTRHRER